MSTKYLGDIHAYDPCVVNWTHSNFRDLKDYAEHITERWNNTVLPSEVVIVDGDIGTLCEDTVKFYMGLNGKKILIVGNHDSEWLRSKVLYDVFQYITPCLKAENLIITHRPEDLQRYGRKSGMYAIHAHHHEYSTNSMQACFQQYASDNLRLNCSCPLNNYKPCTLPELIMNKEMLIYGKQ